MKYCITKLFRELSEKNVNFFFHQANYSISAKSSCSVKDSSWQQSICDSLEISVRFAMVSSPKRAACKKCVCSFGASAEECRNDCGRVFMVGCGCVNYADPHNNCTLAVHHRQLLPHTLPLNKTRTGYRANGANSAWCRERERLTAS